MNMPNKYSSINVSDVVTNREMYLTTDTKENVKDPEVEGENHWRKVSR